VHNVDPVLDVGADVTLDEGDHFQRVGSFADPGDDVWSASVNYRDGSRWQPLALNADKTFVLDHVFAQDGTYDVLVYLADGRGDALQHLRVNVHNAAPTNLELSNATVPENQDVGTVVGTLSSTDRGAHNRPTYTLVKGDADNDLFRIEGDQLKTADRFDFEAK